MLKEEYDVYPSVLASIDTAANAGTADETGAPSSDTSLSHSQFFATGRAARELAANPAVNKAFIAQATESLGAEEVSYGADETSNRIDAWLDKDDGENPPDPTNLTKLKDWLKNPSPPTPRVSTLLSGNYRELRVQAIKDLKIPEIP